MARFVTSHRKPALKELKRRVKETSAAKVAEELGVTTPFIYMMTTGKRHVSVYLAAKLGVVR